MREHPLDAPQGVWENEFSWPVRRLDNHRIGPQQAGKADLSIPRVGAEDDATPWRDGQLTPNGDPATAFQPMELSWSIWMYWLRS